jgi:multiple sugar transport system substrate-binding protein
VKGKCGYAICPGAKQVYNQKAKQWENGRESGINFAPGLWFGGWILGAVKGSKVLDAVFDLAVYMGWERSMDENVLPDSGVNPSRFTHFSNIKAWTEAGFTEAEAKQYLDAIKLTYTHPNRIGDPRIPAIFEYYDNLEQHTNAALVGQESPQAALDAAAASWEQITDRVGRQKVHDLYHSDLGV